MRSEKMNQRTVKKSQFGMVMKRLAKNKMAIVGLAIVSILIIIAALADVIIPYDYGYQDTSALLQPPGAGHLLGTDNLGRDILSRLIYGTRLSMKMGILSRSEERRVGKECL